MPVLGGRHFPYTAKGVSQYATAKRGENREENKGSKKYDRTVIEIAMRKARK